MKIFRFITASFLFISFSYFYLPVIGVEAADDSTVNSKVEPIDPLQSPCGSLSEKQRSESTVCADTTDADPIVGRDGLASRIISVFSWIIGVSSVVVIIYGSIKYVLSGGDSGKVSAAKETVLYALIGIVVALIGRGLITFVLSRT